MLQPTDYDNNPCYNDEQDYYYQDYSEDDDEGDYANTAYLMDYQPPPHILMGYDEYRRQFISE